MGFLYAALVATMLLDAVLISALIWAHASPRFADYRIKLGGSGVPRKGRERVMAIIGLLSPTFVFGVVTLGKGALFSDAPASVLRVALQALAVLVVYDFTYYFLHRTMHHKKLMLFVHGVHHRAKNPSALESFYQHPVELLSGLSLLFLSTWIVGPVSHAAFSIVFFVYSMLNILIHSGFDTRSRALFMVDSITRRHHVHHNDDPEKNFASITPLPDLIFRTAR